MRLLADLWDCRWETRHGAASGLRELLAFPAHTRQAGTRNGLPEAEVSHPDSFTLRLPGVLIVSSLFYRIEQPIGFTLKM